VNAEDFYASESVHNVIRKRKEKWWKHRWRLQIHEDISEHAEIWDRYSIYD
jgi:hypothetical protein